MTVRTILKGEFDKVNKEKKSKRSPFMLTILLNYL